MMTASAGGEGASSSSCPPLPSPHPGTPAAAASSSRSPFGSAASVAAVHLLPSGGGGGSAALSVPAAAVNAEATTAAGSDREAAAEMREDAEVEGREAAGVPVSAREMLAAAIAAARTGAGGGSGSSAPRRRSRSPGAAVACGDASSFRSDGFDGTPEVIGASPMSLAQALAGSSGAAGDGQESQQQQLSSGGMRPQALSSLPPPPLASPALASSPREGRTVRGDPVAPSASDAEGDPQHRQQQRRQSPPTKQPQQEGVQAPSSPSSTAPAATAPGADAAQQQQGPALQQQSQQLLLSWEQQAKAKQAGLPTGRDAAPECPMCLEEFTDDDPAVPQVPCGAAAAAPPLLTQRLLQCVRASEQTTYPRAESSQTAGACLSQEDHAPVAGTDEPLPLFAPMRRAAAAACWAGHDFHLQCILQWAERSHQCPVCSRTLADI